MPRGLGGLSSQPCLLKYSPCNQAFFSSSAGQTRSSTSISSAATFPDPLNFLLRSENCGQLITQSFRFLIVD